MDPHEAALIAANEAFYEAFNRRDIARMDSLWASNAPVACAHPGWAALIGREEVMESWRAILDNPRAPRIRCKDPKAHLYGDAGFVLCIEEIGRTTMLATNVFAREHGDWKLVHHHAGPVSPRAPGSPPPSPRELN